VHCGINQTPAGPSAAQTAALDKEVADRLAERLQGSLVKPLQQSVRQVRPAVSSPWCLTAAAVAPNILV
jgi:hypothetical protein